MKIRNKNSGTLINKGAGKPFLAKWVYEGKVFYKSTGEVDKKKALKKLEEFTLPFRDSSKIAVLNNIEAKIKTTKAEIDIASMKLPGIKLTDLADKFDRLIKQY